MNNFGIKAKYVFRRKKEITIHGERESLWMGDIRDQNIPKNLKQKTQQCVDHDRKCALVAKRR